MALGRGLPMALGRGFPFTWQSVTQWQVIQHVCEHIIHSMCPTHAHAPHMPVLMFLPPRHMLPAGRAVSADYRYLIGVHNELAPRHIPEVKPRMDTLAGPKGRRADMVRYAMPFLVPSQARTWVHMQGLWG